MALSLLEGQSAFRCYPEQKGVPEVGLIGSGVGGLG